MQQKNSQKKLFLSLYRK